MRNRVMTLMVVLVGVSVTTCRPVLAQGTAKVAPMHFHHVHLNSVNPKAAADYYLKPFPLSTTRTIFNGYEAVKTGNVYLLFTKVDTPPLTELNGPQSSVWHFGWNTPDSRKYDEEFRAKGLKIAQMWDATASSSTCPAMFCRDCQRKSRSSKCEQKAYSRPGRGASGICGVRTTR